MTQEQINELRKLAQAATPGPWMYLLGDRFVYDRLNDGCRGNSIVGVDHAWAGNRNDLNYVAAANPAAILALIQQRDKLLAALKSAKRAIGDHYAPDDCYATGPLTGDAFLDLVQCPACAFIELHNAAITKAETKS